MGAEPGLRRAVRHPGARPPSQLTDGPQFYLARRRQPEAPCQTKRGAIARAPLVKADLRSAVIRSFTVRGNIQALALFIFSDPETDQQVDDLEGDERHDR